MSGRVPVTGSIVWLSCLRFAEPIEVARCILFPAGDDASFVIGSVTVADGGYITK